MGFVTIEKWEMKRLKLYVQQLLQPQGIIATVLEVLK